MKAVCNVFLVPMRDGTDARADVFLQERNNPTRRLVGIALPKGLDP